MRTKFMIWRFEKNFFLDFDLKGAIDKCVDCFLVYPILKLLIKKRKRESRDEGSDVTV